MIIFVAFLGCWSLCTNFCLVVICLFGLGVALGCDYPTAHMIISESIPAPTAASWCLARSPSRRWARSPAPVSASRPHVIDAGPGAWRWMYATAHRSGPGGHHWPLLHHRERELAACARRARKAESGDQRLLAAQAAISRRTSGCAADNAAASEAARGNKSVSAPVQRLATAAPRSSPRCPGSSRISAPMASASSRRSILAAAIGCQVDHVRSVSDLIADTILAAKGAALINVLLIVGILVRVVLRTSVGRIRLQIIGFIGCAVGLFIASISDDADGINEDRAYLRRLHAVQLHDQYWPERADLSARRRGVPDRGPRHGRGLRRRLREDRRGCHGLSVPHPARPTSAPPACSVSWSARPFWVPWSPGPSVSKPPA